MPFTLLTPSTVAEAVAALAQDEGARPLGGGTDLLLDLEEGRLQAGRLVSLARLPWDRLVRSDGQLRIGSTLPLRTLERDPRLPRDLPGLYEAVRSVGGVPLRHRATLGGNLARASPASDLIPILLALAARVHLVGPSDPRTVGLDEFLRASRSVDLARGELIEAVEVPESAPCAYSWQRVRPSNDISQVGVAVAYHSGEGRWAVALGGVVPRPVRLPTVEAVLSEPTPDEAARAEAARVAARDAPFASDRRASASYRRQLVEVLLTRALRAALREGASA
ncbi:MAG TPA: FAD binding domain-containing protein [Thermoplasmata archaeon]|nr:FAD binding domain-containing protein [Thermoplasmata archaeon]